MDNLFQKTNLQFKEGQRLVFQPKTGSAYSYLINSRNKQYLHCTSNAGNPKSFRVKKLKEDDFFSIEYVETYNAKCTVRDIERRTAV